MKKLLAPSLLSADFSNLNQQIRTVINAGADIIHVDCMDNHFVPNLTFGPVVIENLTKQFDVPFDVHLMVTDPASLVDPFIDAGASMISVHAEVDVHLHRTLDKIRSRGAKAGIVLNPATPLIQLQDSMQWCDYLLLMSVNPGFASQSFIPEILKKISDARRIIEENNYNILIQVDGGIKKDNLKDVLEAGTDIAVAGSAIFSVKDPAAEIKLFKKIIEAFA